MDIKYMAFVGTESYDIAILLGILLEKLGSHLTIVDATTRGDLWSSIQMPADKGVTEFHNVTVCRNEISKADLSEFVIVLANENIDIPVMKLCKEFWIFTDFQRQNLEFCQKISLTGDIARFLIYSTDLGVNLPKEVVKELTATLNIQDSNRFTIDTEWRHPFMFALQNSSKLDLRKMPNSVASLLCEILSCDYESGELKEALKGVKQIL